jgi:hypothetical protein
LIGSRVPRNAIGWLLGLIGLSLAFTMLTEQYALRGLAVAPGSLPAARLAGWLSGVMFVFTFAPMFFVVLLFPDGRLPSRRWRPVLWAMFAVLAGGVSPLRPDHERPGRPGGRRPILGIHPHRPHGRHSAGLRGGGAEVPAV